MPITHLLLDIEGTTCPVSFVADVLFPYARQRLASFLEQHAEEQEIAELMRQVSARWQQDSSPGAQALRHRIHRQEAPQGGQVDAEAVVPYLEWLIDHDIKDTALKDLQGRIWKAGYADGSIVAPLFGDVPDALHRWRGEGAVLAVYSSGSIPAQQLLYGHTRAGDLRPLFSHWFDTRTGLKQEASSYASICNSMGCPNEKVLFISDSPSELNAAQQAGLQVLFSDRPGNPCREAGVFERISDYSTLSLVDAAHRP